MATAYQIPLLPHFTMDDHDCPASAGYCLRRNQFAIVGPWGHGAGGTSIGDLNFGDEARMDLGKLQMEWFDYWLKDQETGVESWPAYKLFVMGENRWRNADQWPLKETKYTPFYFSSDGQASDFSKERGVLHFRKPDVTGKDTYEYDPADPVPTLGGNNLVGPAAGPYDQREVSKRKDVLTFTSEPLKEKLEATGPVKVVLYASSTATDTDFTAKLMDVRPDGKAYNLCDGIIRARFRDSFTEPTLIQPGEVIRYEIDLWVTSNAFLPGHRVRVDISSSNFPRFDRNPNSGKTFGTDTELLKATQTIYHGGEWASHLLLPVIPNGH